MSSEPYKPSGLADAAGVTETDATGAPGATAATDTALLSTEEVERIDLVASSGSHAATGLTVASDETDEIGESVATGASDPSSDLAASTDAAPPTATANSVDLATGSAGPSLSGVVVSPPPDSDSDSDSEMAESQTNNLFLPPKFRGLTTENAKDWIRQFENYCSYKEYSDPKKMALLRSSWSIQLQCGSTNTWANLKIAFETRYNSPEFM